ncbi:MULTISPECIES: hypothetical protein [unclassified Pseudomonas]|nr:MULTISPECIES: hypothetical protein [unclassified Pseudomonas]
MSLLEKRGAACLKKRRFFQKWEAPFFLGLLLGESAFGFGRYIRFFGNGC